MTLETAFIITGAELLGGIRQDALIQPFCAGITARGGEVCEVRIIGDDVNELSESIEEFSVRADLVVVTGGLGGTPDDLSHRVIAELRTRALAERVIENHVGYAPGVDFDLPAARVCFLPGVPRESLPMFRALLETLPESDAAKVEIPCFGLREGEIAERLGELGKECSYLPKDMEVLLMAPQRREAEVREILGEHALRMPLARELGEVLKSRGLVAASAESCTGGLIAHLLTSVAGSSEYFAGSVISYSNEVKTGLLGVPEEMIAAHGAVSEEVADAMLDGALTATGADVAMATTGVAGPTGGSAEKPVGTIWIAAGSREERVVQCFHFPFDRAGNQIVAAKAALFLLRRVLCGHSSPWSFPKR